MTRSRWTLGCLAVPLFLAASLGRFDVAESAPPPEKDGPIVFSDVTKEAPFLYSEVAEPEKECKGEG